ncbi:hypothetical protein ACJJTC_015498 [Scirpophaga incertulas]
MNFWLDDTDRNKALFEKDTDEADEYISVCVASPTRIRQFQWLGVPHHLEVELNGLGEDCVMSIWRAKCPSVANPTRIRTVPVVGVPHHLEVELNGLGEDCVISVWQG